MHIHPCTFSRTHTVHTIQKRRRKRVWEERAHKHKVSHMYTQPTSSINEHIQLSNSNDIIENQHTQL